MSAPTVTPAATRRTSQRRVRGSLRTRVIHDRYPSKDALDAAMASGSTGWNPESFDQLDELLATRGTSGRGRSGIGSR